MLGDHWLLGQKRTLKVIRWMNSFLFSITAERSSSLGWKIVREWKLGASLINSFNISLNHFVWESSLHWDNLSLHSSHPLDISREIRKAAVGAWRYQQMRSPCHRGGHWERTRQGSGTSRQKQNGQQARLTVRRTKAGSQLRCSRGYHCAEPEANLGKEPIHLFLPELSFSW